MRSLFIRIFVTFSIAFVFVSLAVLLTAAGSRALPVTLPFLTRVVFEDEIVASAKSAEALYRTGGGPSLALYFRTMRESSGTQGWLMDSEGHDVLGQSIPAEVARAAEMARSMAEPHVEIKGYRFTAATRVHTTEPQGPVLVLQRRLIATPFRGALYKELARRYLAGLAAFTVFCYALARLLTAPLRTLRRHMREYSAGKTAIPLPPALLRRRDDLGDLSRDFEHMRVRVNELLERQQQLIADISHELRSPLTRLGVAIEIARDHPGVEPELLQRMTRETEHLEKLIAQLLRLAALESQAITSFTTPVSLNEVLETIVDNAVFEASALGKAVDYVPPANDINVCGEEGLLSSAIENVLRNAIYYTPPGTGVHVRVETADSHNFVALIIRDHGPGIPESQIGEILKPFYRIEASRDRKKGGAGLGLSIAERSVKVCGGSISVANHPEGGALVTIQLRELAQKF